MPDEKLSELDARHDSQAIVRDQGILGSQLLAHLNADYWAVVVPSKRTRP